METFGIEELGIAQPKAVYRNLGIAQLVERTLERGEGQLSESGALVVKTGKYTGRAAKHKFIVDTPGVHDDINWGSVNQPISREKFDALWNRVAEYLNEKEVFIFDGFAGADMNCAKGFRIVNELPAQNLFIHQLLRRPTAEQLEAFVADYTLIAAPGFKCDPERDGVIGDCAIILDYEAHKILIAGSGYAGEIKKSVFSTMNYILPKMGIMPMHCSANMDPENGTTAVFFGLSGTGKTTLSADPNRQLIGDDEHGWSDNSVFNFEGGCYAKCINLSAEGEPEIYNAIKYGSLAENIVMDEQTREFDFDDESLTTNTRVGYPIDYIPNAVLEGVGEAPSTVIFLTADAFGVLPPVSKLTLDQAMYYFVSGFTSKVAGTELGVTTPEPTFSACFGEPFLPLHPAKYAEMLKDRILATGANVYLVNTGWNGKGERMKLRYTRAMVTAALNGTIENAEFVEDPSFGLAIPASIEGCTDEVLFPKNSWDDEAAYEESARKLAHMLNDNFQKKYADHMSAEVAAAGPRLA